MRSSKALCLAASLMLALTPATVCLAADPHLNFKIYSPQDPPAETPAGDAEASGVDVTPVVETSPSETATKDSAPQTSIFEDDSASKADKGDAPSLTTPLPETTEAPLAVEKPISETPVADTAISEPAAETPLAGAETPAADISSAVSTTEVRTETKEKESKLLQGFVRVVPMGTKIPIVMDTAVDSDTSQEGDEFSARTSEDLAIDGNTVVPAGSIIKGRIATLNSPRALNRSGSVALKFDNITTPDNRQIPLVATLVARGGVVHARRGLKDYSIDAGTVALPLLLGLAIGAVAGNSNNNTNTNSTSTTDDNKMSKGGAAMIGAGIGLAVGVAVLLAKKGKKIEVRPGDELKIELAEELRMPTM